MYTAQAPPRTLHRQFPGGPPLAGLAAGARRSDLESRMRGHVLGRGELVATYQRD